MKAHIPEEEKIVANGNIQMKLYDLNKQIISQMADLTNEDLKDSKNIITEYLQKQGNKFYMLLCRDINYYTLFKTSTEAKLPAAASEVLECAKTIGTIKSVDINDNNAIEIWVHAENSEPLAMYLFPYDLGVIECRL